MQDGTNPIWFIFGVGLIIWFLSSQYKNSKKEMDEGRGDDKLEYTGDGQFRTKKDDHLSIVILIVVFGGALLVVLFR